MRRVTLVIVLTLFAAGCRSGEIPELEGLTDSPPLGYDLDEVQYVGKNWTPEKLRYLRDHGFVVTDETYHQICSFYIHNENPSFITTDSALYAYFVNLEESLYRLELAQADRLPQLLKKLRSRLAKERAKYRPGVGDAVWKKAARDLDDYLLVAETLTYAETKGAIPEGTPGEVASEIELILTAKGPAKSPLRGVPLDYSRFEARGLYAKGYPLPEELGYGPDDRAYVDGEVRGWYRELPPPPKLGGGESERREDEKVPVEKRAGKLRTYYRAVTWLHEVPFRVSDENETLQALLLAALDVALGPKESPLAAFNAPYLEFLGPSDDPGIKEYRRVYLEHAGSLARLARDEECRKKVFAAVRELPPPRHTTVPEVAAVEDPARYAGLRVVPRPALYENEIFNALFPFGKVRLPVSGEELFAVMGSRAAQEIVKGREARRVPGYDKLFPAAVVAAKEAEKTYDTEICRKRRALYRTLLDTPEDPKLPRYYRHSAWRYKDLNTCLAGWSHQRYIWDLHSKRDLSYKGGPRTPPTSVVEPNVAFFRTLAELSRKSARFFSRHGVKGHRFDDFAKFAATLAAIASRQLKREPLDSGQSKLLKFYGVVLADFCGFHSTSWCSDEDLPDTSFCVPISVDLFTRNERVVGQARPRAVYVICERDGETFLAEGGVLSYRDWLGPAWGEGKMTEEKWLDLATKGELKGPAWQEKFYVSGEIQE